MKLTDYETEPVYRSTPRWAWEVIDETLAMDARSSAFDPKLRETIRVALHAMIMSCEEEN